MKVFKSGTYIYCFLFQVNQFIDVVKLCVFAHAMMLSSFKNLFFWFKISVCFAFSMVKSQCWVKRSRISQFSWVTSARFSTQGSSAWACLTSIYYVLLGLLAEKKHKQFSWKYGGKWKFFENWNVKKERKWVELEKEIF